MAEERMMTPDAVEALLAEAAAFEDEQRRKRAALFASLRSQRAWLASALTETNEALEKLGEE